MNVFYLHGIKYILTLLIPVCHINTFINPHFTSQKRNSITCRSRLHSFTRVSLNCVNVNILTSQNCLVTGFLGVLQEQTRTKFVISLPKGFGIINMVCKNQNFVGPSNIF